MNTKEEQIAFWADVVGEEVVGGNDAPAPPVKSPYWRVLCELCEWRVTQLDSRNEAIALGRTHSYEDHPEEYEFRVQQISLQ
jgi:hypothetical protein